MPLLNGGPPLATIQPAPDPAAPDEPIQTEAYLFEGGQWTTARAVDLSSASAPFLTGETISARQMLGPATSIELLGS